MRAKSLRLLLMILAFGLCFSGAAWAQTDGRLRFGGDAGFGIAQVQVSGSKRTEKPGTFAVQIDYALKSYLVVGVEHYRTLVNDNGPSSGVGFTGVFGKYYLFSTRAPVMPQDSHISQDEIVVKAISPYVGLSAGIGQASLRSLDQSQGQDRSLSVGSFIGGKVGIEYPISHPWTTYVEGGAAATVVGTGTIIFVRVGAGLLYNL